MSIPRCLIRGLVADDDSAWLPRMLKITSRLLRPGGILAAPVQDVSAAEVGRQKRPSLSDRRSEPPECVDRRVRETYGVFEFHGTAMLFGESSKMAIRNSGGILS